MFVRVIGEFVCLLLVNWCVFCVNVVIYIDLFVDGSKLIRKKFFFILYIYLSEGK